LRSAVKPIALSVSQLIPLLSVLLATSGCNNLFFVPDSHYYSMPYDWHKPYEFYPTQADDGTILHHWFFPVENAKGTVFVVHGNAQNISAHAASSAWISNHGYNVFLFEYRGFGQSGGKPDLKATMRDIEIAFNTISQRKEVRGRPIFLLGQSLGASISIYPVATSTMKNRLCALILEAPFSDYRNIAREKLAGSILTWPFQYPLSLLIDNTYNPLRFIDRLKPLPILIIHSKDDRIVPIHHGLLLYKKAEPPKAFWEVQGPHAAYFATRQGRQRLLGYLAQISTTCISDSARNELQ